MKLVLLRHGESVWNKENRFTGWTNVELSSLGIEEAKEAGKILKENNYSFDVAYTSVLKRANQTLDYVLEELGVSLPTKYDWRLNERHYGALQGLNKEETKEKYGEKQVHEWRRGFYTYPPKLDLDDERYPGKDPKYSNLSVDELPLSENLADTMKRVIKLYEEDIKKDLLNNKDVLVVAHGNSLRALIKYLENINDTDIMDLEIKTGKVYVYELDNNLNIIKKYHL